MKWRRLWFGTDTFFAGERLLLTVPYGPSGLFVYRTETLETYLIYYEMGTGEYQFLFQANSLAKYPFGGDIPDSERQKVFAEMDEAIYSLYRRHIKFA